MTEETRQAALTAALTVLPRPESLDVDQLGAWLHAVQRIDKWLVYGTNPRDLPDRDTAVGRLAKRMLAVEQLITDGVRVAAVAEGGASSGWPEIARTTIDGRVLSSRDEYDRLTHAAIYAMLHGAVLRGTSTTQHPDGPRMCVFGLTDRPPS